MINSVWSFKWRWLTSQEENRLMWPTQNISTDFSSNKRDESICTGWGVSWGISTSRAVFVVFMVPT